MKPWIVFMLAAVLIVGMAVAYGRWTECGPSIAIGTVWKQAGC